MLANRSLEMAIQQFQMFLAGCRQRKGAPVKLDAFLLDAFLQPFAGNPLR